MALAGVELAVYEAGTGDPVVLLHGWPQHGGMWAPVAGALARTRRVIVPDLRGFGDSEVTAGGYDKHTLAADILGLLDSDGIERAAIVGHDWGGWIAWLLALEHPERVERFASLDVPSPVGQDLSPVRIPARLLFSSYQLAIASPLLGERLVRTRRVMRTFIQGATGKRLSEDVLEGYARAVSAGEHPRASVALYRTFLLAELPAVFAGTYTQRELTVPGLVLMGSRSPVARLTGIPAPAPNLAVDVIGGVGHFMVDEAPDAVLARLEPFLSASVASTEPLAGAGAAADPAR